MIYSLKGELLDRSTNSIVVECGGVGFYCISPASTVSKLPPVGNQVFVYTYMSVREDAMDLYAFSSKEELEIFKLIISVSGIGGKIGVGILSEFSAEKLVLLVSTGDYKSLTAAPGVGAKTAQRIVLELKDKLGSGVDLSTAVQASVVSTPSAGSASAEAIEALVALGCSQSEAVLAVSRLDSSLSVEELIKQALKSMVR